MRPPPHPDRNNPKGASLPQTKSSTTKPIREPEIILLSHPRAILPLGRPPFRRRTPRRNCLRLHRLQQRRRSVRPRRR
ncbi:hypothetical protein LINPERPRIM_LOCUS4237 [Linum perenne]